MSNDYYRVSFLVDEPPDSAAVISACLDAGLTTAKDGRTDVCEEYYVDGERYMDKDGKQIETVVKHLSGADTGLVSFWHDGFMKVIVWFAWVEDRLWNEPGLEFRFNRHSVDPSRRDGSGIGVDPTDYTQEKIRSRIEVLIDAVEALTEVVNPKYAWSGLSTPHHSSAPDQRPISKAVDELHWITILSEPLIEELGGRKYVLNTPAWRIAELETGHVVIVKTDHPLHPNIRPDDSPSAYLFGDDDEK